MGELIPYTLKSDDGISVIILISFFIITFVLASSRKYLLQQGKNFILHRERFSLFVSDTSLNSNFSFLLILHMCFLVALVFHAWFQYKCPILIQEISSWKLFGIYTILAMFYVFFKRVIYTFIGWIYSDKGTTSLWLNSYFTLVYYFGFTLFPYVLLLVYFDFDKQIVLTLGCVILIITKILMLYKWLKFFFINIYGLSLLILYFCALEIVPCLLLYQALVDINSLLLIKI